MVSVGVIVVTISGKQKPPMIGSTLCYQIDDVDVAGRCSDRPRQFHAAQSRQVSRQREQSPAARNRRGTATLGNSCPVGPHTTALAAVPRQRSHAGRPNATVGSVSGRGGDVAAPPRFRFRACIEWMDPVRCGVESQRTCSLVRFGLRVKAVGSVARRGRGKVVSRRTEMTLPCATFGCARPTAKRLLTTQRNGATCGQGKPRTAPVGLISVTSSWGHGVPSLTGRAESHDRTQPTA